MKICRSPCTSVGLARRSIIYTRHIYPSGVIPFLMPVLMGMVSMMSGGIFDRFPDPARGLFGSRLSVGSFYSRTLASSLSTFGEESCRTSFRAPRRSKSLRRWNTSKTGNIYFSSEVEDALVAAGAGFGRRRTNAVRFRYAAWRPRTLRRQDVARPQDISDQAKTKILESNPAKFYRLPGFEWFLLPSRTQRISNSMT